MTTKIRRRAIRLIDAAAATLVLLAVGRLAYVMVTPLTLETLTVGPALAVAASVYIVAAALAMVSLGALLMLCMIFRRSSLRRRALVSYLAGVVLFAGLSVATEAWIVHHRTSASEAAAAAAHGQAPKTKGQQA
ncbi:MULTISPECIES: hypothetical protein [Cupriavidus]